MDAAWLKQNVGDVLTAAMADCARKQPEDPISFLGKHLLNYVEAAERQQREAGRAEDGAELAKNEEQILSMQRAEDEAEAYSAAAIPIAIAKAMSELTAAREIEFVEEMHGKDSFLSVADELEAMTMLKFEKALDYLRFNANVESAYLAKLTPEGDLEFVSSTNPRIKGQVLKDIVDEEGKSTVLPFAVLVPDPVAEGEEGEENPADSPDDPDAPESSEKGPESEEPKEIKLPRFIHVPNMLRNDQVPFLGRIPTLGSFAAIHVPFRSSMHKEAIPEDGGLIVPEAAAPSGGEDADEEKATNEGDAEDEEGTAASEAAGEGGAEGEELTPPPTPRKEWRANTKDAAYILCIDTLGSSRFVEGIPQENIDLARKMAYHLGEMLTTIENSSYQAEMLHRDALAQMNEANKQLVTEHLASAEQEIQETLDKMRAEASPDPVAEGEGEPAATTEPMLEEELAYKESLSKLQVIQKTLAITSWWKDNVRAYVKLCIEPEEHVQKALHVFMRVFVSPYRASASTDVSWHKLKKEEHAAWFSIVEEFDPSEPGSEACCGLDAATSLALLEEAKALTFEEPAWIPAVARIAVTALEAVVARQAHLDKLSELEAQRLAAEAEAAAAAEAEEDA